MDRAKKPTDDNEPPKPEVLQPQSKSHKAASPSLSDHVAAVSSHHVVHRGQYRPSHKATFIGLAVVAAVLAINGGIIAFVMGSQQKAGADASNQNVTLSDNALSGLGVNRNTAGENGAELIVGPASTFKSKVSVGSDLTVAGQLQLKSKFTASDASLARLQAGEVALQSLGVNGDATVTNLNLRRDLKVAGATTLQGPVTMSQLLTINNSLNVAGNVAVGGVLSAQSFQANSLVSGSTLTIGGHIITRGSAPNVGSGGAVGSNGTVSISGNDASGTVAVNTGTGAGGGLLAQVAFRSQYGTMPHVVVTPVGRYADVYVTRTIGGFSIYVNGPMAPGGYAFDYMVMQ